MIPPETGTANGRAGKAARPKRSRKPSNGKPERAEAKSERIDDSTLSYPPTFPMNALIRAALADYRERLRTDFKSDLSMGCHIPAGEPETHQAKYNALSSVEKILHRLVIAAHGGAGDNSPWGVLALNVDGVLVVVDEADGTDDGERIHIIEPSNVITLA